MLIAETDVTFALPSPFYLFTGLLFQTMPDDIQLLPKGLSKVCEKQRHRLTAVYDTLSQKASFTSGLALGKNGQFWPRHSAFREKNEHTTSSGRWMFASSTSFI